MLKPTDTRPLIYVEIIIDYNKSIERGYLLFPLHLGPFY